MGLREAIQDETVQAHVVADCTRLMDEQVSAKGGISGLALKTTYGVIKGLGADYIPTAIQRLLPDAFDALDPLWSEGLAAGDPVAHLSDNSSRAAEMILGLTDVKIQHSNNKVVKVSYGQLRKSVKADLEAAVPGLAQIIGAHARG